MLLLCHKKNICNLDHRTESYKNIHFLTRFYHFSQWIRRAIFQINTDLLVIYQSINSSTQETLYPSFILKKKKWLSQLQAFFETYHISTFPFTLNGEEDL